MADSRTMRDDPLRSPTWRWLQATALFENGKRIRPSDDEWVRRARKFLASGGGQPATPDKRRRPHHDQAITDAFSVFRDGPKASRTRLEAYLLTSTPLDVVATRCLLSLEAVEAFTAVFYDVKDRLTARDWIIAQAIGSTSPQGLREDYPHRLLKLVAFIGGQHVLESTSAVLNGLPPAPPSGLSFEAATAWQRETELRCKLNVARLLAQTPEEYAALARFGDELHRASNPCGVTQKPRDSLESIMADFLSMLEGAGTRRRRKPQKRTRVAKPKSAALLPPSVALELLPLISQ